MDTFVNALFSFNAIEIIKLGGYIAIAALIFSESGLLVGIFFPGDSLLFAAGLLAAKGYLQLDILLLVTVLAAIFGDSIGYWFGVRLGRGLFTREDSRFFKHDYLVRTERFYEQYGGRAILFARFVPIVRTMAPILAGASSMRYRAFLIYNIIGGVLWSAAVTLSGFFLGTTIPNSEHYLLPVSLVIIVLSLLPIVVNLLRNRKTTVLAK